MLERYDIQKLEKQIFGEELEDDMYTFRPMSLNRHHHA